eukprot:TRINITY_DN20041_c0_g2_i3.p1 TRINITY_DN20041_c0_g2~~TRINITY_DN20041_c0_g2_i3.p1  ORF type:complete len:239 (+),score=42.94 TRINITY_DN20041_c0_g2_i3:65-718(+)
MARGSPLPVLVLLASCLCSCSLAKKYEVLCSTTAGNMTVELTDTWSPKGVERFLELVEAEVFDGQLFYRVVPGFLLQFGVAADPEVHKVWQRKTIEDEPRLRDFEHGTLSFAGSGVNSRSCHMFIALEPNGVRLGMMPHETPIGKVTEGLEVLDAIVSNFRSSGYGDLTPLQGRLGADGNVALKKYDKLDQISYCRLKDGTVSAGQASSGSAQHDEL